MRRKNLHKVAPKLSEVSLKSSAFKIPENYFESFEDGVIAELKSQELAQKYHRNNFEISEEYFESIDNQVINKLNKYPEVNKKQPKLRTLQKPFIKYIVGGAIAASMALFFIVNTKETNNVTFDSLTTNEIENSINDGIVIVNQVTLAAAFPDVDFSTNTPILSISDDDIYEYLSSENIETIIYEN